MWILKKINRGTNLVPTVQPNGADRAPVAAMRRAQCLAEQAAPVRAGRGGPQHQTSRRAVVDVAQPGQAISCRSIAP